MLKILSEWVFKETRQTGEPLAIWIRMRESAFVSGIEETRTNASSHKQRRIARNLLWMQVSIRGRRSTIGPDESQTDSALILPEERRL